MLVVKTIGKWIGNLFFVLLFALIVVGGVGYAVGYRPYVVMSGSMEPTIHTGSLAVVNTNTSYQDAKVDDIIAFKSGDTLVTHRVVNKNSEGLTTKGDANTASDASKVTVDNFKGTTVFSIPGLGFGIQWIQTTQGKIVMGTLIAVIVMLRIILYTRTTN